MSLKNLASLNSSELKNFLNSFDDVLCDCDGVLWRVNEPVAGVKETLQKLSECGKRIRYVSNNCTVGMERYITKLDSFQFESTADDVVYPTLAIIDYLKNINYQKEVYLISGPVMQKEFKEAGFLLADPPKKNVEQMDDLKMLLEDNEKIGAVVVDVDLNLTYGKLVKAASYLRRPEVLFITAATDRIYPVGTNGLFMGPGYFQDVLISFANRVPVRFGKPAINLNKYILNRFNIQNSSRVLFVGDSLEQDIEFASNCGYQKLLVLTGITSLEKVTECKNKNRIPDYYMNSFGELHKIIKDKLNI